jgi:hypothetical protein
LAVTVDQANLGTQAESGVTSSSLNTGAAVASGAMIVALVHNFNSAAETLSMSGGSLTWTQAHTLTSGSLRLSLFYAFAPSGLASGTTLTVTASVGGSNDMTWCVASYLGVDTSGTVVAFNAAAASTAAWSSGSVAGNSGNALIGGAGGDGTLRTSTPDAGNNERIDFNSATTSGSITLVDKLSISGTDSLDGDWSGTLSHIGIGVAFKPAAAGGSLAYDERSLRHHLRRR